MCAVLELIWTGSYGSTTIDQICEKAGVKKGSFYYFFESKSDVATAALDAQFQKQRTELDASFSAMIPPLVRIANYCDFALRKQLEIKEKCGRVLGCPLFTLGAEVSTQEQELRGKIEEILGYHGSYLESAVRDAHAAGVIHAPDAAAKARMIRAYYEGLLTQARIANDVNVLRELKGGVFAMLGVKEPETVAA